MVILEVLRKVTRNNTIMAFLKLEDLSESILVIVFQKS
ncbi:putative DNA polymerase III DnaE (plasmid) [Clostridium botulinum]|nr:putative DNA polymerase III DnaE [Clostridium botulinum]